MNLLFICNQNKHRSKTAEELLKSNYNTRSAGLFGGRRVSEKDMAWADLIIVMEEEQRKELGARFPKLYLQKQIVSCEIPDRYCYGQPELKLILKTRFNTLLKPFLKL